MDSKPDTLAIDDRPTTVEPRIRPIPASSVPTVAHSPSLGYRVVKRTLDIALASVLLVVLSPVLLVAAVVVKASGLPVFFRQERVGRHGRPFTIHKFDTMRRAPLEICVKWEDDRVTRSGRWLRTLRIDELPQLWNILRGDMTLIGPRPLPPEVVDEAKRSRPEYPARELVTPGLTSWAKVRNPNSHFSIDPQMLEDDLYYVEHASLLLDLKVLAMTPAAVVRGLFHFRATAQAPVAIAPAASAE